MKNPGHTLFGVRDHTGVNPVNPESGTHTLFRIPARDTHAFRLKSAGRSAPRKASMSRGPAPASKFRASAHPLKTDVRRCVNCQERLPMRGRTLSWANDRRRSNGSSSGPRGRHAVAEPRQERDSGRLRLCGTAGEKQLPADHGRLAFSRRARATLRHLGVRKPASRMQRPSAVPCSRSTPGRG